MKENDLIFILADDVNEVLDHVKQLSSEQATH
jgi:hypothetical protein